MESRGGREYSYDRETALLLDRMGAVDTQRDCSDDWTEALDALKRCFHDAAEIYLKSNLGEMFAYVVKPPPWSETKFVDILYHHAKTFEECGLPPHLIRHARHLEALVKKQGRRAASVFDALHVAAVVRSVARILPETITVGSDAVVEAVEIAETEEKLRSGKEAIQTVYDKIKQKIERELDSEERFRPSRQFSYGEERGGSGWGGSYGERDGGDDYDSGYGRYQPGRGAGREERPYGRQSHEERRDSPRYGGDRGYGGGKGWDEPNRQRSNEYYQETPSGDYGGDRFGDGRGWDRERRGPAREDSRRSDNWEERGSSCGASRTDLPRRPPRSGGPRGPQRTASGNTYGGTRGGRDDEPLGRSMSDADRGYYDRKPAWTEKNDRERFQDRDMPPSRRSAERQGSGHSYGDSHDFERTRSFESRGSSEREAHGTGWGGGGRSGGGDRGWGETDRSGGPRREDRGRREDRRVGSGWGGALEQESGSDWGGSGRGSGWGTERKTEDSGSGWGGARKTEDSGSGWGGSGGGSGWGAKRKTEEHGSGWGQGQKSAPPAARETSTETPPDNPWGIASSSTQVENPWGPTTTKAEPETPADDPWGSIAPQSEAPKEDPWGSALADTQKQSPAENPWSRPGAEPQVDTTARKEIPIRTDALDNSKQEENLSPVEVLHQPGEDNPWGAAAPSATSVETPTDHPSGPDRTAANPWSQPLEPTSPEQSPWGAPVSDRAPQADNPWSQPLQGMSTEPNPWNAPLSTEPVKEDNPWGQPSSERADVTGGTQSADDVWGAPMDAQSSSNHQGNDKAVDATGSVHDQPPQSSPWGATEAKQSKDRRAHDAWQRMTESNPWNTQANEDLVKWKSTPFSSTEGDEKPSTGSSQSSVKLLGPPPGFEGHPKRSHSTPHSLTPPEAEMQSMEISRDASEPPANAT